MSNLDKVLYPATGTTKAAVIDYYVRVAPLVLPHLRDRPITLKRYPDGVAGDFFYEKNCPSHRPSWIRTERIATSGSRRRDGSGDSIEFCVDDDLASLVWIANLASIEVHPYLHCAGDPDRPTMVVFDLDPGGPADLVTCAEIGLRLREALAPLGLRSVVKTSGGKGLQVYVPLNVPVTYARTTPFARAVAQLLERRHPDRVTSNMRKDLRHGRVLIDWSQNNRHKTTVGVYSLRARERPTVSTPVTWDEVEDAAASGEPHLLTFELDEVLRRASERGDLFAGAVEWQQELPDPGRSTS